MKKMIYILFGVALLLGLLYMLWENTHFVVTNYEYKHSRVPEEMDGLRILQISDLHNQSFGKGNRRLLAAVRESKADVIMITGDLIDSTFTDTEKALAFAKELVEIAPVYYCTGNHEHRLKAAELRQFLSDLSAIGVNVLTDATMPFYGGTLVGLKDPSGKKHTLRRLVKDKLPEEFVLLMSHKPHYYENYLEADLVLTGHAHGGQVRLPWIGGLFAPGQGWLPEHTKGFYTVENTTMLVSRGAGNSHRLPRVFNFPELVLLTINGE